MYRLSTCLSLFEPPESHSPPCASCPPSRAFAAAFKIPASIAAFSLFCPSGCPNGGPFSVVALDGVRPMSEFRRPECKAPSPLDATDDLRRPISAGTSPGLKAPSEVCSTTELRRRAGAEAMGLAMSETATDDLRL